MTSLTFGGATSRLARLHQLPHLERAGQLPGPRLVDTGRILTALRLSAEADMRANNHHESTPNPIDVMLRQTIAPPIFARMTQAIAQAQRATAFDVPQDRPRTNRWVRGAPVRLERRPPDDVELPTSIPLGTTGLLRGNVTDTEWGDGWSVEFDTHGTWWTTTASLELL